MSDDRPDPETTEPGTPPAPPIDTDQGGGDEAVLRGNRPAASSDVDVLRGNRPAPAGNDVTVLRGNRPSSAGNDVTVLRGGQPGSTSSPGVRVFRPGSGQPAPVEQVHSENMAEARMQGYDWTQINDHLAAARTTAQAWGYSDAEVNDHLGIQDSSAAFNRFSQTWNQEFAANPDRLADVTTPVTLPTAGVNWANNLPAQAGIDQTHPPFPSLPQFNPNGIEPGISEPTLPGEPGKLSPTGLFKNKPGVSLPLNLFNSNMRDDFAYAISHDMVQNVDQFTDLYARAAFGALDPYAKGQRGNLYAEATGVIKDNLELARQQLKASLPHPNDFLDVGILLAQQQDMEADPTAAVAVRNRLLDHWTNTGMEPMLTYRSAQNNPALQALLAGTDADQHADHPFTNAVKDVGHAMGEGWNTNWAGNLDNWPDLQKAFESQSNPVLGTLYAGYAGMVGTSATALSTAFRATGAAILPVLAAGNQWLSEIGIHGFEGNTQAMPGTPAGSAETAAQQLGTITAMLPDFALLHSASYPGKLLGPGETGVAPAPFVKASNAYRALSATTKAVIEDESGALKPIKPVVADPLAKDPAATTKKVDPAALVPASQDFSIKAMPPVRELDTEGKPLGAFRPQDHSIMSGDGKTPLTIAQVTRDETGANARLTPNPDLTPEMKLEVARRVMSDDRAVRSITLDDKAGAFDRGAIFKGGDVMAKMGMQPADIMEKLVQDKVGSSASKGFAKKAAFTPDQPGHAFTEIAEKADADPATVDLAKGHDVGAAVEQAFHDLRTNPTGKLGPDLFLSVEGAMRKANMRTTRDLARAQAITNNGDATHSIAYIKSIMRPWYSAAKPFLNDYVDQRRSGVPGAFMDNPLHIMTKMIDGTAGTVTLDRNSPLHPVAEGMQALFADVMAKMKAVGITPEQYFQDAYRTLWRRPGKADAAFLGGRNQLDHWPTPSEGLEKGLEANDPHPLNMYSKVLGQAYHAIAAKETLNWGEKMVYHGIPLLEYQVGSAKAPIGYMQLTGAGATKITMVKTGEVDANGKPKMKPATASAWADPGFAKTYNYWQSRGMYDGTGPEADGPTRFFRQAQYFTNTVLGMKLLVPTYHALAITGETMIATLATGMGELAGGVSMGVRGQAGAGGELLRGLKDVGLAATGVGSVAQTLVRGWKFHNEYMQKSLADSPAAQAFADAGGRGEAQRQELFASAKGGNWFEAIRHNSLSFELKEGARDALFGRRDAASVFKWSPDQSPAERALLAPARVLGFAAHELGRIVNTFTAPVFDGLVPFSKMGAYGNEMDMFLRQNPTANREAITARGRMLVNSMDNRFGELNQSNLFWHALTKQFLNTALVSVGWEYGSLRAFGNAAGWDIGHNMGRGALAWNPVAFRWALAFGAGAAYQNAIYQYARTGKLPWQTNTWLMDLIQPRDSGVYPDGMPRRGVLPGYQKDVFNMARVIMNPSGHAAGQKDELESLLTGKLTPAWKMLYNATLGLPDIRNSPIKTPGGGYRKSDVTSWNDLSANFYYHVLRPGLIPIQQETTEQLRRGTGLNKPLTIAGIRETAPWMADYPAYKRGVDKHDKVQQTIALSRARKTDAQLLNPDE